MASKAINTILNLKDNYSKTVNQATSNTTKFKNTVSSVTSTLNNLKQKTTGAFGSIAKSAIGITAGYVGIKSAISYVKEGMEMAKSSELANAQLGAVLASTNNAIGMTKDQLLELAGSYGSYTTYTKGAVLEGENLLLTFTGIGKDVLPDVTTTMLDMSTAMKQDVSSSAMMLGKALNDPTAGLSKLTKQGVTFSEQQKKQIESMQKAGDVAGAQKIMLAELQKEFGGSAKAAGDTLPGKLQILKNTFNGLKKTVGEKFIPVLYDITKFATDHLPQIKSIFSTVFGVIGNVVKGAVDIFKNNLLPVFLEIWQHAEPYITKIREFLPQAFEKVKEVAGNVFDGIKSFIDNNKESVGNFIDKFLELAKTIWDSVSPAIENITTNVLPKLQEAFSGNSGAVKDILDKATDVFNFINTNWKEIKPIVLTIVGALSAYKLALIAVEINTTIVSVLTSAWAFITGIINGIRTATSLWTLAQWALNVAMEANYIGTVIGLLALLGLAIYEVVTHWQELKDKIIELKDTALKDIKEEFEKIKVKINDTITAVSKDFDNLKTKLEEHKTAIKVTATILTAIFGPALLVTGIKAIISGAQITTSFVASIVTAGVEAVVSGIRITVSFIASMAKAGVEAMINGIKITASFVASIVTAGTEAVISGAKITVSFIASLIETSAQAIITAGVITGQLIVSLISYAIQGWETVASIAATSVAWLVQKGIIMGTTVATYAMEAAQLALNIAMDANPIGVVILALAGLGLAIYEVVKHWKDICEWIEKAWNWLTTWNGTKAENKDISVTEHRMIETSSVTDGNDLLHPKLDLGTNATGTNYWKGGRTTTSEHGDEVISLPSGSKVFTANQSKQLLSGASGGHVFNFNFNGNVGSEEFFNQAGEFIVNKVNLVLNNNM